MLSSEDRAEIQARADAATEGPWHIEKDSELDYEAGIPFAEWPQSLVGPMQGDPTRWAIEQNAANRIDEINELTFPDAEFIAHARTDIPKLLAELTRIEQALERATTEAEAIRSAYLDFWGAHSSNDIEAVGRRPKMPETPALDAIGRAHVLGDNEGKTTL